MKKLLRLIDQNILFWGICFLLLFIPLYPKFPLFAVSDTYVSIRLEDLFVTLIVFLFGLKILIKRDFSIFKWKITHLVLLYFIIGVLSVVSGIFITKNIVPHLAFLHFLRRVEYVSLLFIAYYSLKEIKQLKTLGWIVLISTFGVIIYAIGQKYLGWPVVSTMNREFSKGLFLRLTWWARVNSTFAGHYDLAAYMVMILSLCTASILIIKDKVKKVLVLFLGLLSYYILVLTASRISFAAYLMGIVFILWFAKKRAWIAPFIGLSILGMILSGDLGQRYAATFKIDLSFLSGQVLFKPSQVALAPTLTPFPTSTPTPVPGGSSGGTGTRGGKIVIPTPTPTEEPVATDSGYYIEPTLLATSRSTDIRLKVEWPRAIMAFLKNPLLGTGYSSITLATDNDYLRMLGETGLLGALAFLAIVLEISRRFFNFLSDKNSLKIMKFFILGVSGAAMGYFINATFIDVLEASKIAFFFWIMVGIALRVIDLEKEKQKNKT